MASAMSNQKNDCTSSSSKANPLVFRFWLPAFVTISSECALQNAEMQSIIESTIVQDLSNLLQTDSLVNVH